MVIIYRCRNCYNMEFAFTQLLRIRSKFNRCILYGVITDFSRRINSSVIQIHLGRIEIISDHLDLLCIGNRNRHADISKSHKRKFLFSA